MSARRNLSPARGSELAFQRNGSTRRWRRIRARVLWARPFCEVEGCRRIALHVDHVIPLVDGGDDSLLQALCPQHHMIKTADENRRRRIEREWPASAWEVE